MKGAIRSSSASFCPQTQQVLRSSSPLLLQPPHQTLDLLMPTRRWFLEPLLQFLHDVLESYARLCQQGTE